MTEFERGFELGKLVGLLEGEGCFGLKGRSGIRIEVVSTDKDVIESIHNTIKTGKMNSVDVSKYNYKAKLQYRYYLFGRDALKVMRLVRPYMSERRGKRIDEIIETVLKYRPFIEISPDFCEQKGHSIKYPDETILYSISGSKMCARCQGRRVWPHIEVNPINLNQRAFNPFTKKKDVA